MEGDDVFRWKGLRIWFLQRKGSRRKNIYWIIAILSSPAQESKLIAIDVFPDTSTHNSTSENLEGSPWAAWKSKINSSTSATLANLNVQIFVLCGGELLNALNF